VDGFEIGRVVAGRDGGYIDLTNSGHTMVEPSIAAAVGSAQKMIAKAGVLHRTEGYLR
jgi:hypothetical protein